MYRSYNLYEYTTSIGQEQRTLQGADSPPAARASSLECPRTSPQGAARRRDRPEACPTGFAPLARNLLRWSFLPLP
jgi:hypothetical protein